MNDRIERISKPNDDFRKLVSKLDEYLEVIDEDEHDFYDQFNSIESLEHIVLAYKNEIPVGCGAFKAFDLDSVEVKRMYVSPNERGSGLAKSILNELETWASEAGFKRCILETGKRQGEAVKFYLKCGYQIIPNYDQYIGIENSLCLEKRFRNED